MLRGTGREFEVYDVAGPIFRLTATVVPIKCHPSSSSTTMRPAS
jgi:hypothetical protein